MRTAVSIASVTTDRCKGAAMSSSNSLSGTTYAGYYDEDAPELENVAKGLFLIAHAITSAAKTLGLNDAATPMGAIEAHSAEVKHVADAIEDLASRIPDNDGVAAAQKIADAIEDGFSELAKALADR